jgi:N-acetylglutamate synthase-like GNAT family acetyltransferase
MEREPVAGYSVTSDQSRIDIEAVHDYLSNESYWAKGVPIEVVRKSIENSVSFAVVDPQGKLTGFARVITDRATFAYLADVFILEAHRGKGLSKFLMQQILAHPELQGLRRWLLITRDAHKLYSTYAGFTAVAKPQNLMERHTTAVYESHSKRSA